VLAIVAGILVARHLKTPEDLGESRPSPRTFLVLNARKCGGGGSTLAGIFFTMPAMSSVVYAAGAWVALRSKQHRDRASTKQGTTSLG
jgi:hypothetical protein